ncbi:hypothetical protein E2C01_023746 [Portunus trituberculatus]|uniref:Uncharacterized protein n=1 Tax=Portunus trituberculatus TaxID=210409 RepID=A0A5B7EAU8_PORTR|nr:hypothetical protein [Portunus trituberculatus]
MNQSLAYHSVVLRSLQSWAPMGCRPVRQSDESPDCRNFVYAPALIQGRIGTFWSLGARCEQDAKLQNFARRPKKVCGSGNTRTR